MTKESPDDQTEESQPFMTDVATDHRVPPDAEWELITQAPFGPSESQGLTAAIVYAVADVEDVAPKEIRSPPLYEVIDTGALEAAFFTSDEETYSNNPLSSTEFMYRGHRVVVRSDGWVLVHERVDE